jgi:hypothetical protein
MCIMGSIHENLIQILQNVQSIVENTYATVYVKVFQSSFVFGLETIV